MNTAHLHLDIDGMSCGSCISHVRSALASVPGIRVDDVRIGRAVVTVRPDVPEQAIRDAVLGAGYTLRSLEGAPLRAP